MSSPRFRSRPLGGLHLATLVALGFTLGPRSALCADDPARSDPARGPTPESTPGLPPTAEAPPPSGDIIETIEEDGSSSSFSPAPTAAGPLPSSAQFAALAPEAPDRFELNGWARQSVELGFSKNALRAAEPEFGALPYDRVTSRSQLFVRARYSRGRWFEASVSGALSYSFFEQGPDQSTTTFNGFNGQSARGVVEPRLQELFVGFFAHKLDLRIGQQRLSWGKGEFISPNDVMNARDLRDPFVGESELRTLPTFLIRADWDMGFGTLQAAVAPVFTPDRYDVSDANWAAIQPDAPAWMRGVAGVARRSIDPTLQEQAQRLLAATRYPDNDLTEPVVGGRFSWSAGGVDVNHYYQYGFDGPRVTLDPALGLALAGVDWSRAGLVDLQPLFAAIDANQEPIKVRYLRRHHIGMDVGATLGPIALRLDAAYQTRRSFFQRDLSSLVSPSLQVVGALEYQTFDKDKLLLLEGVYLRVMDNLPAPLLIYRLDSFAVAGTVRWPLYRGLGVDIRAMIGIQPRTAIVQPELTAKVEPFTFALGGLWLDGVPYSLGHYYRRNREVYVKAKYFF